MQNGWDESVFLTQAKRGVYAMHKRVAEVALETAVRRGDIDGVALRIPGVVARPDLAQGLKSAFLSNLFHAMRQGRDFAMPVAPEGRVVYCPDPDIMQGFGAFGEVRAMQASRLGYPADRDLNELIARAF